MPVAFEVSRLLWLGISADRDGKTPAYLSMVKAKRKSSQPSFIYQFIECGTQNVLFKQSVVQAPYDQGTQEVELFIAL